MLWSRWLYFTRIENPKKDSIDRIFRWRTRCVKFCHWNLHAYSANFVRARIFREAGYRIEALEIRGHFEKLRAIRRKQGRE
jgi:hypothetical protein